MSRASVVWTGLIGLLGAAVITALSIFVIIQGWIPVLVEQPLYVWALFLFLLIFAVAEIPVMVFGLRRIAASDNPKAKYVTLLVNIGFPLFGAVYAAPFILLTGRLVPGVAMAALSLVRFIVAVIFLPGGPAQERSDSAAAW